LLNETNLAIKNFYNFKDINQNGFFGPLFLLLFLIRIAKELPLSTHAGFLFEPVFRINPNGPASS